MAQRLPGELAFVGAGADPQWERQILGGEGLHDGAGRAGAGEGREQVGDGVLHADVGIEHDLAGRVIDEADRQCHLQFAAAGLGELAAASRARMKCSSASDIVPLRPSRRRSLKQAGS